MNGALERRCQLLRLSAASRPPELLEIVVRGPVVGGEQRAGLGVDRGVPQMRVRRDRRSPSARRAAARPRSAASRASPRSAPARSRRPTGRICDLAPLRRSTRTLAGRVASRSESAALAAADAASRLCVSEATVARLTERAAGEDDLVVGADVDRELAAEDLEVAEALVEVDVRDAEPCGLVHARHEHVGDVGARHPELLRVRAEIRARDLARVRPDAGVAPPARAHPTARTGSGPRSFLSTGSPFTVVPGPDPQPPRHTLLPTLRDYRPARRRASDTH